MASAREQDATARLALEQAAADEIRKKSAMQDRAHRVATREREEAAQALQDQIAGQRGELERAEARQGQLEALVEEARAGREAAEARAGSLAEDVLKLAAQVTVAQAAADARVVGPAMPLTPSSSDKHLEAALQEARADAVKHCMAVTQLHEELGRVGGGLKAAQDEAARAQKGQEDAANSAAQYQTDALQAQQQAQRVAEIKRARETALEEAEERERVLEASSYP